MKILVTGATGFVGKNLIAKLEECDIDYVAIVRSETNFFKSSYVFNGDVAALTCFIQDRYFEGVVHLASCFIGEHKSEQIDDLVNANLLFGAKILEASVKGGIKWFLNTGTYWQHYNGASYDPVNLYAATKQAFEDIAKYYVEAYDLNFCTLKLSDTYGENDTRKKIFALWKQIAKNGEELGMSAGEQYVDIVHIDTATSAYLELIQKLHKDTDKKLKYTSYCLSSGERITLKELAKKYEETHGVKLNIKWGVRPYRQREPMHPCCVGKYIVNNGEI